MDKLTVIQADRDAAANYMKVVGDKRWYIGGILNGGCDNTTIVRSLAAHRLDQIKALENPTEELVLAALEHADLDGEVYHIEDFQKFIQGIAAHLKGQL